MRTALALVLLAAAPALAAPPIFGGTPVGDATELERAIKASTVLIVAFSRHADGKGFTERHCSAVVYGPTSLMTAAHCVRGAGKILAFLNPAVEIDVYGLHRTADLAVLSLPAAVSGRHKPVNRGREAPPAEGAAVWLAGFGTSASTTGSHEGKDSLRMVELVVGKREGLRYTVPQSTEKGACSGDSGGPAFVMEDGKPALAGIISFVAGPATIGTLFGGSPSCTAYSEIEAPRTLDFARDLAFWGVLDARPIRLPDL